jgi:dCMP deaminase
MTDLDGILEARRAATKSPDPRTKVGCAIYNPHTGKLVAASSNDLPSCVGTGNSGARLLPPAKYVWIEHAERRAIYDAAKRGTATDGCVAFVSGGFPCCECGRAIVQSGIVRVVFEIGASVTDHWEESYGISRQMFSEAGVEVVEFA